MTLDPVKILVGALFLLTLTGSAWMVTSSSSVEDSLVCADPYAEGLKTHEERLRREASRQLGWRGTVEVTGQGVSLRLTDARGEALSDAQVFGTLIHPTESGEDRRLSFSSRGGGVYHASGPFPPGTWDLDLSASRDNGEWLERMRVKIP